MPLKPFGEEQSHVFLERKSGAPQRRPSKISWLSVATRGRQPEARQSASKEKRLTAASNKAFMCGDITRYHKLVKIRPNV